MTGISWRTELVSLFAARGNPALQRRRLSALSEMADALLPDASGYDTDIVDLLRYAVDLADATAMYELEARACRKAALAFLHAGVAPTAKDRELIASSNRQAYNGNPESKLARDSFAYMTYRRVQGESRDQGYSYKPGATIRSDFAAALRDAVALAEANHDDFRAIVHHRRRSEQDAHGIDSRHKTLGTASTENRIDRSNARDVNFPDGSMVPLGAKFTKTWEVRNIGQVAWIGRRLTRQTPQGVTFPSSADWVPIPDTFPGESVRLSVDFVASRVQGFTEVRFKMTDEFGNLFFPSKYPQGLTLLIETAGVEWIQRPIDLT